MKFNLYESRIKENFILTYCLEEEEKDHAREHIGCNDKLSELIRGHENVIPILLEKIKEYNVQNISLKSNLKYKGRVLDEDELNKLKYELIQKNNGLTIDIIFEKLPEEPEK